MELDFTDIARFITALDSGGVLERAVDGPGYGFELARRAVWLLLTERTGGSGSRRDA